ncbi:GntR family transcriptional regulator [Microbacterium amylolyticum]|uniref:DNA-binding GntR family transcriptional regulator n=1 Tax=Microbacterium amylolyticum TaxID=936337 RepID=A0ABS4ZJF8_9MICO|nr:GntR family transcriptional regulator [Microbacterium amylolyticum]MBP2437422.1 DNA-binding GntR family transcriptional regulator [Microbacterium amylolyticum]
MSARDEAITAQPARLADVVYDQLAQAVVDGTLAPGQRVRDGDLADQLGVSRMPVREALQRLERQGLIEMVASRYTRVTDVTPDMPAASLEFLGYQSGIALRLAVPRMNSEERAHAAALARDIRPATARGGKEGYEAAWSLFSYLASCSGNFIFQNMISDAWLVLTRNLGEHVPLLADEAGVAEVYERIATNIIDGDAAAAEMEIRAFLRLGPGQEGVAAFFPKDDDTSDDTDV